MDSASTSSGEESLPSSRAGFDIDRQSNKGQSNAGRGLSNPWSHVVRGQPASERASTSNSSASATNAYMNSEHVERHRQSEQSSSSKTSSDSTDNSDNNIPTSHARQDDLPSPSTSSDDLARPSAESSNSTSKKPAWKKPAAKSVEVGAVMGADTWPSLGDARIGKTLDLSKPQSEGSATQGLPLAAASQKAAGNSNPGVTQNQVLPNRQKSAGKRGGPANGILPQFVPSDPPQPLQVHDRFLPVPDVVFPDPARKGSGEFGMRSFMPAPANTEQHRHHYQRGNGTHNSYSNSYGNRRNMREQGRFNPELNSHRSFNARDNISIQQRVGPRNFFRPPQPPFINPVRSFTNPMGFPSNTGPMYYVPPGPLESVRGVPYFPPAPHPGVYISGQDVHLRAVLGKQIDYYFSVENLCRDLFLRENMDEQGWVPVSLIANFNRVRQLTSNLAFILDVLRNSNVVEVQGDKIRKREHWSNWVLPRGSYRSVSNTQPQGSSREEKSMNNIKHAVLDSRSEGEPSTKHATSKNGSELEDSNGQMCAFGKHLDGSCHRKDAVHSGSSSSDTGSDLCAAERESSDQHIIDGLLDVRINHRD